MTTHFLDLTLRDDPHIAAPHLLGALCDHLHLALVQQQRSDIGISFPGYALRPRTLGTTLRLHGSETGLQALQTTEWLRGMRDHVCASPIGKAPAEAVHRTVQRRQFKTSAERLRRRRMRRKGETIEQATTAIPSSMERKPNLPYLQLHSHSSRQPFCLFIVLGETQVRASAGTFNTYGLSTTATVPWF